jgi:hypothetical protein
MGQGLWFRVRGLGCGVYPDTFQLPPPPPELAFPHPSQPVHLRENLIQLMRHPLSIVQAVEKSGNRNTRHTGLEDTIKERLFIDLMTSDRKVQAFREGSK